MKHYQQPKLRIIDLESEQMIAASGNAAEDPTITIPGMGFGSNERRQSSIWNETDDSEGNSIWK